MRGQWQTYERSLTTLVLLWREAYPPGNIPPWLLQSVNLGVLQSTEDAMQREVPEDLAVLQKRRGEPSSEELCLL